MKDYSTIGDYRESITAIDAILNNLNYKELPDEWEETASPLLFGKGHAKELVRKRRIYSLKIELKRMGKAVEDGTVQENERTPKKVGEDMTDANLDDYIRKWEESKR